MFCWARSCFQCSITVARSLILCFWCTRFKNIEKKNPYEWNLLFLWWSSENFLCMHFSNWYVRVCIHAFHCTSLFWEEHHVSVWTSSWMKRWHPDTRLGEQVGENQSSAQWEAALPTRWEASEIKCSERITLDIDFAESCLKRISRRGETKSSWIQKKTPTYLNASRMALCKVQPQISYSHSYELYVSFVLFFIRKWECFPTDKTKGQYFQYQPVYWCSCVYKLCILLFLWSYFNFIFWHILSGHLLQ